MAGITSIMYLFLLQDRYFKEDNPLEGLILAIAVGAIIVFSVLLYIIRRITSRSTLVEKSSSSPITPRKFNVFSFRHIASSYGLNRDQIKLLEAVFKNNGVTDPERVLKDPTLLDRHFKRAFNTIEKNYTSDEDTQERLANLFSLRNVLDGFPAAGKANPASIPENTPAILASGRESYPVKILTSRNQSVVTEIPRNVLGSPIRLVKGAPVSLSFFTKASNGFSFDGKINGFVNTDHGQGVQIAHTGKMKPLVKRQFHRRHIDVRCEFSPVRLEVYGKGRKKTSKLIVENKKFTGIVDNLSAGGCAMKSAAPIQAGSRLKIKIDNDENYPINILGQVLRSNKSGARTVFHIKFLKVPRRAFNSISVLVFGYNDD